MRINQFLSDRMKQNTRKTISFWLVVTMVLEILSISPHAANGYSADSGAEITLFLYGDVNLDNEFDLNEMLLMQKNYRRFTRSARSYTHRLG